MLMSEEQEMGGTVTLRSYNTRKEISYLKEAVVQR